MNDTPEKPVEKKAAAPKKNQYVVANADIWTADGRKAVGEVVELTASEARHFVKIGTLDPYIPDDEEQVI